MRTWHVLSRNILYSVIISNALASIWSLFFILPHGHQKINLSFMVEWCPVLSFRAMTKKQTCYSRSDKSDFLEKITKYDQQTSFSRLSWGEQDSEGALYVSLAHSCSTMSFCRLDLFRSKFSDRPNKYSAKAHKDVIQSLHIAWSFL